MVCEVIEVLKTFPIFCAMDRKDKFYYKRYRTQTCNNAPKICINESKKLNKNKSSSAQVHRIIFLDLFAPPLQACWAPPRLQADVTVPYYGNGFCKKSSKASKTPLTPLRALNSLPIQLSLNFFSRTGSELLSFQ